MHDLQVLLSGSNLSRLMGGLWLSVRVALLSMGLSVLIGLPLGFVMTLRSRAVAAVCRAYLETVRIMPQLVLLFIVYFGFTRAFGVNFTGETAAVIVFTFWGAAEMGELTRGAALSVPRHQSESALALGMGRLTVYARVIAPQTLRRLAAPAVNLATRMVKTTSLVALIGVADVMKVGQQIIEGNRYTAPAAALWVYGAALALYFLACWPISRLAGRLERRWETHDG